MKEAFSGLKEAYLGVGALIGLYAIIGEIRTYLKFGDPINYIVVLFGILIIVVCWRSYSNMERD